MAVVTRQRTGELVRKLVGILIAHPDGLQARDALAKLRETVTLSEHERGSYDSGGTRFDQIVRFATVDLKKAGWIQKETGRWSVTDQGQVAYAQYQDPLAFYKRAVELYGEWKKSQPSDSTADVNESQPETREKSIQVTYDEAEEQAFDQIQDYLSKMPPYEFQELVASLLRAMGYFVVWEAPPGKDGGIDIVAWSDPLNTRPPRIKVQVKRVSQKIPVDVLRSFMGVLKEDDVGVFVTLSEFTKDAEDEARTQERRKITLLDLAGLLELWKANHSRLDDVARRLLPLKPIYFLAPTT